MNYRGVWTGFNNKTHLTEEDHWTKTLCGKSTNEYDVGGIVYDPLGDNVCNNCRAVVRRREQPRLFVTQEPPPSS